MYVYVYVVTIMTTYDTIIIGIRARSYIIRQRCKARADAKGAKLTQTSAH
jgi:hypothetical protein